MTIIVLKFLTLWEESCVFFHSDLVLIIAGES